MSSSEYQLAASLLAVPNYVQALFPAGANTGLLESPEVKAIITVLATRGKVFASPGAMLSVLEDLPTAFDPDVLTTIFSNIPDPEEVELTTLTALRFEAESRASDRRLAKQLTAAGQQLAQSGGVDVLDSLEKALREYRARQTGGTDYGASAVLGRIYEGKFTQRWGAFSGVKGGELIDHQFRGITADGSVHTGAIGAGEVTVIAAKYGVGKTRLLYNILGSLIEQGASCSVLVGEDNEAKYLVKLAAARFGIEAYIFEQYLHRKAIFLGQEINEVCAAAEAWVTAAKVRFYDGQMSRRNFYRFPQALALMEEDKALHGTNVIFVDYVQMWKGETSVLEENAQSLREFAGRTNTALVLLSQIPNAAMVENTTPGVLNTKGSGEWGQIAHNGYQLHHDPAIGQRELQITQSKSREAGYRVFYAGMHPPSGRVTEVYETPKFMAISDPEERSRGRSKTKKG